MAHLGRAIHDSIAHGSALFNNGRQQECAEVYHDCARMCLNSGQLPPPCRSALEQGMQRAAIQFRESGNAEGAAWELRRALDYTLNFVQQQGVSPGYSGVPAYGGGGYGSYNGGGVHGGRPAAYGGISYAATSPRPPPQKWQSNTSYYRPAQGGDGWGVAGGAALGAAGGLGAGMLLAGGGCGAEAALVGGGLGAAAGGLASGRTSGAIAGGAGGAAAGLMLAGADSGPEAVAMGGGMLGGAALGGAYGGVGGAAVGALTGGLIGDFAVDSGPGDCLAM
eukprot:gnl/TRDRNA2_/TRDRNA2_134532_c0_seq1.p1 gnl/TRDRNA2_/TRDRNA2_134532_c0~~gnl/TRDRNA2_/TRDRNA2_134532_c0_seq1.p1  ORF type:complete len:295 (-),score=45.34 gnl/TRDRNA2_/TRDRNA2_134532_c0_seq1:44-880(-)